MRIPLERALAGISLAALARALFSGWGNWGGVAQALAARANG